MSLLCCLCAVSATAQPNLLVNGGMEVDEDGDGRPDHWHSAGDVNTVTQRLTTGAGHLGERSACLQCTRCVQENPASHAMLCQMGRMNVEKGAWYRLSLWAKQTGLDGFPVMVALVDMSNWSGMGLSDALAPGTEWERYEFLFQASRGASATMRLQLCFLRTGTLWVDDVQMVKADGRREPTLVWPAAGGTNLTPNGGFECGADGWGSVGRYTDAGWPRPMNRLFGDVVEEDVFEGLKCFKITMSPQTTPVSYFDCMQMVRSPVRVMLTGNVGWLRTTPGEEYCLSAYLRADLDDCPARLVIQPFGCQAIERSIEVGADWRRYELSAAAPSAWCSVLLGPDLSRGDMDRCTLWIDAIQFEPGAAATAYARRAPVETGLCTHRRGNVLYEGDPAVVHLTVDNRGAEPAQIVLSATDFDDRLVAGRSLIVAPGEAPLVKSVDLGVSKCGFYRVHTTVNGRRKGRGMRMAIIPRYTGADSVFGVNHAYPWDHLLRECIDAGVLWVRDWSLKWHDVQREPGPFDFAEADRQIDRPIALGQHVLGLLPFPSNNWSSSAPPEVTAGDGYPAIGGRTAYAPRSDEQFASYVGATVAHYRDRVRWWQVFNEPVYTAHALPQEHGYSGTDYGRLVRVFSRAAKGANADCKVLAGIGAWPDGAGRFFREMFQTGALAHVDAVDVHTYPGLAPPESLESGLCELQQLMVEFGGAKPVWLTEHGYYSDDDFEISPARHGGFNIPLSSERTQAIYSMRLNVILLANGVQRIFYHAGTCPGLNADNTEGIFFEYGGAPRKIYPALAAFAQLLPVGCESLGELDWGEHVKAYLFGLDGRLVLAAWKLPGGPDTRVAWDDPRIAARDIMGNRLDASYVELSDAPAFVTARGMTPQEILGSLRRGG